MPDTHVVIGGRSMGGRIATIIVAGGADVAGLVAFAYPLHQPGHPEKARIGHLPDIHVPTLFCSGTRDAFGTPEEMASAAAQVEGSTLHLMDAADHGFAVLKRSGRTQNQVFTEAITTLLEFVEQHGIS
jgi:predicted alpha/beta-hydrolase family hydrolase